MCEGIDAVVRDDFIFKERAEFQFKRRPADAVIFRVLFLRQRYNSPVIGFQSYRTVALLVDVMRFDVFALPTDAARQGTNPRQVVRVTSAYFLRLRIHAVLRKAIWYVSRISIQSFKASAKSTLISFGVAYRFVT